MILALSAWANPVTFEGCVQAETLPRIAAEEANEAVVAGYNAPERGAELLTALIERHPDCGALWMARAGTRHARGLDEEAEDDLRRAQRLGDPNALRALAVHLHDRDGAGEVLDLAVEQHPDDAHLKVLRAQEKPVSQRSSLLVEAHEAHPDDAEVTLEMVTALDDAGRPWEAIERGRSWLEHHPNAQVEALVAQIEAPFEEEERFRPTPGEFKTLADGTEEVVVYSPARARQELENRLIQLGWTEVKEKKGRKRFRSPKPVQPFVDIFDGGVVFVQKSGLVKTTEPQPGQGTPIPVISERKLRKKRVRLMEDIAPQVWAWQQAITRETFQEKLNQSLPDALTLLWEHGQTLEGEGELESLEQRRDALIIHWQTRACTPEGDAVRAIVGKFFERIVQESEVALSEAAVAAAEKEGACKGRFLVEPALALPPR